jgi:hypothetical protein
MIFMSKIFEQDLQDLLEAPSSIRSVNRQIGSLEPSPCLELIGDGNVLLKDGPNPGLFRSILKL